MLHETVVLSNALWSVWLVWWIMPKKVVRFDQKVIIFFEFANFSLGKFLVNFSFIVGPVWHHCSILFRYRFFHYCFNVFLVDFGSKINPKSIIPTLFFSIFFLSLCTFWTFCFIFIFAEMQNFRRLNPNDRLTWRDYT